MIDRLIMAVLFVVLCAWLGLHIILAAVETWRASRRRKVFSDAAVESTHEINHRPRCTVCGRALPNVLPKFPKLYGMTQEQKDEIMVHQVHVTCCLATPKTNRPSIYGEILK